MFSIKTKIGKLDFHQIQPYIQISFIVQLGHIRCFNCYIIDASKRISFELTEMTLSTIRNCIVLDCYSMYCMIITKLALLWGEAQFCLPSLCLLKERKVKKI